MQDIDWNNLSLDELKGIERKAAKAITSFEDRRKKEALAALQATADEMGFSLNELLGGSKSNTIKAAPKYAHPENSERTWSGRGRQPTWFKEAVEAGTDAADLLISA